MSNIIYRCQACGSSNYSRERRPNGYTTCQDCKFSCLSSEWDKIEVCALTEENTDEDLQNKIIMILRDFSKDNLHNATTGLQRMYAKDVIKLIRNSSE